MNRIRKSGEGKLAHDKLASVVEKHLQNIELNYYGAIPYGRYLLHSIEIQKPVVISHPKAKIAEYLSGINRQIYANYVKWNNEQMNDSPAISYFSLLEKIAQNYDLE